MIVQFLSHLTFISTLPGEVKVVNLTHFRFSLPKMKIFKFILNFLLIYISIFGLF